MKWRDLARDANGRSAVLVFEHGDNVMPLLKRWCADQQISSAHFTAIGAFESVTVAWFNWETKHDPESGLALIDPDAIG